MSKLSGLRCIITGGAGGLGLATTQSLIKHGAKVVICDLPTSNGHLLAQGINKERCLFHPTDVTSENDMKSAIQLAQEKFGSLDVLVNCAGLSSIQRVYNKNRDRTIHMESYHRLMDTNCVGTFNAIRLACEAFALNEPDINGQRGVIVNTASISGYEGQSGQAAYAASKGAIISMTLPISRDLSSMGVRVMTIAPGYFESELIMKDKEIDDPLYQSKKPNVKRFLGGQSPFPGRLGDPDEYAHMVKTIIENPMLNGEVIRLDGATRLNP